MGFAEWFIVVAVVGVVIVYVGGGILGSIADGYSR